MTTQVSVETLSTITYKQIPVITTELLAHLYGTEAIRIRQNHHENKGRFIEEKHFFKLEGETLREFKHRVAFNYSVKIARNVRSLILWTERGAARHAKMLETDRACELWLNLRLLFGLCCFSLAEIAVFQFFEHFPRPIGFEHFCMTGCAAFCP